MPPPRFVSVVPSFALRLDVAVVADGDVDEAVDAEAAAVGRVIGAAEVEVEAEAGDDVLLLVGHAVAVGVGDRR